MEDQITQSVEFLEVMSWIKSQDNPTVSNLKKFLISKNVPKNQIKYIANGYRYIIQMRVNIAKYNQQRLK